MNDMSNAPTQADELAESIRKVGRGPGTHLETWVSIGLAFTLTVVGCVIFWRTQAVLKEAGTELGPVATSRLQTLLEGALLPFLALSAGSFLILVVTVLAMRWTRLRLEREQRQAQVSDLVMRLVGQYQDEHLCRISSWLHDGIGHGLVLQKMDVEYMMQKKQVSQADGLRVIEQLKGLIDETRNMASMIYPHTLFQFGLAAGLANLTENFRRMAHIPIEEEIGALDGCCSDEVAMLVFRIVQEALTNVAKHAQAAHVWVRVACDADGLSGSVSNDGLVPESGEHRRKGIGLMVISERAKRLGGQVTVESCEGEPYRLLFAFPHRGGGCQAPA